MWYTLLINQESFPWEESRNQRRKLTIVHGDDGGGQTNNGTIKPSALRKRLIGFPKKESGVNI